MVAEGHPKLMTERSWGTLQTRDHKDIQATALLS
jgi:hypothetical protein